MKPDMLITTYLEMNDRNNFRPTYIDASDSKIIQMTQLDIEYYLFLYRSVGYQWRWYDRLRMPEKELEAILKSENLSIYVLYVRGVPAGYVELKKEGHNTEIAYFGLRSNFIGRGLGKHLLSFGIEQAWEEGAERVWVHTCNLDGPNALANYRARGFVIYDVVEEPMPERYR